MYQRSNGTWCDAVTINGKKTFFYGKTQKEVKQKMAAWKKADKRVYFRDIANEWFDYHSSQAAVTSHNSYKRPFTRALEQFSDIPISDITPQQVQAYLRQLADTGLAKGTIKRHKFVLNMIFDYAILKPNSGISTSPTTAVKIPAHSTPPKMRLPPSDEVMAMVTPDTEMGLFAFIAMYTGLRRGEILALTYDDIDYDSKLIHVTKSVSWIANKPVIKAPKTETSIRDVDLLDVVAAAIPKGVGYVFGGDQPFTQSEYQTKWLHWCTSLGLVEPVKRWTSARGKRFQAVRLKPTVNVHQFRHAYATMLDEIGIDDTTAMQILGHAKISTTKDIYTHLRKSKRQRAATAINDFVNSSK